MLKALKLKLNKLENALFAICTRENKTNRSVKFRTYYNRIYDKFSNL